MENIQTYGGTATKKSGNKSRYAYDIQLQTVFEYLTGDESARDIGDRLS